MAQDSRARVWQIVFYPESCPDDFLEIIENWHVPCLLSPLHDPSKNKVLTDSELKEHYHLNIYFNSKKSYEQVLELAEQLNTKRIEKVLDSRSMTRYLIHFDSPDKQQFKIEDLKPFSGVDYLDYFMYSSNYLVLVNKLENIIETHKFYNLWDLRKYLRNSDDTENEELLNYIRTNTYYTQALLNSMYQKRFRADLLDSIDENNKKYLEDINK